MLSALLAFCERNPPVIRGLLPQRAGNAEIWYLMFLEQTVVTGDLRRYVGHVMSRWCTSVKSLQMARRLGKSKWNLDSMVWKGNFALNKKNSQQWLHLTPKTCVLATPRNSMFLNKLKREQKSRHCGNVFSSDDKFDVSIQISLKFVDKIPIDNNSTLQYAFR